MIYWYDADIDDDDDYDELMMMMMLTMMMTMMMMMIMMMRITLKNTLQHIPPRSPCECTSSQLQRARWEKTSYFLNSISLFRYIIVLIHVVFLFVMNNVLKFSNSPHS